MKIKLQITENQINFWKFKDIISVCHYYYPKSELELIVYVRETEL